MRLFCGYATRSILPWAFLASLLLHAALLVWPGGELASLARAPEVPPPPPPLVARFLPPPVPQPGPTGPSAVLKNTLDLPQAEVLKDPIPPRPRTRITDKKTEARAKTEAPRPTQAESSGAPPKEASGLDLRTPPRERAETLPPEQLRETLGKLSEEMLYPSEALRRGLEGEVVILIELGPGGQIIDASIASGSGHPLLDSAAVRAVRKLGTLGPSSANKTILLPVKFRIL